MPRYMMKIQYDGSRFSGWQIQKNAKTVAGTLTFCLSDILKENTVLFGSGRTDAGVHAIGQTAHFDVVQPIEEQSILIKLNEQLPSGLSVVSIMKVHERFHVRHHALSRVYIYQLSKNEQVFLRNYVWTPEKLLKPEMMSEVLKLYTGFHDFTSFSAEKDKEVSTHVNILKSDLVQWESLYLLRFVGSHFLRSMVRRLVGTAVAVANKIYSLDDVKHFLAESCTEPSRHTAPPHGLFLESVQYDKENEVPKNIVPPIITSLGKNYGV